MVRNVWRIGEARAERGGAMKAMLPGTKRSETIMRQTILEAVIYATALALHDTFGFGAIRTQRVINAVSEIMEGYADEQGSDIINGMLTELKARKIEFSIKGRR